MKKVLRYENNEDFWNRTWMENANDPDEFPVLSIYPLKYAEMVMDNPSSRVVELGVGLGRVFKHYFYAGYDIAGLERSSIAVQRLNNENPSFNIHLGDVRCLPYADEAFDVVLAFGVFHNFEEGMDNSLAETARCLKKNGRFCISMRPNNYEANLHDLYWKLKQCYRYKEQRKFYQWLVSKHEFQQMLRSYGLYTDCVYYVRYVSILYYFPLLRDCSINENEHRSKGYRLNMIARQLDRLSLKLLPSQFCDVLVFIGHKK